jgi:hypothetical protein
MAESPPPPGRTTSREHVSRIDRTYFQRPSRFQVTRRWLIVAGLAAAVAWCGWAALDASLHVAPGPVHAAHAKWEKDCSACHVPFSPIKNDTWLSTAATRHVMDAKCESCHRGPAHHPLQMAAEVGSCASCHADHRGRTADISRVADQTCTACHADIAAHRLADAGLEPSRVSTPITRFDAEHHPPFASLAADPGRLKFSHGRHMRAGLSFADAAAPDAGRAGGRAGPWTYAMLPTGDRGRYQPAGSREQDLVQLDCGSCHEFGASLAAGDTRTVSGRLAAAAPGAYPLPVHFERHCAACHTLPVEGVADGGSGLEIPPTRPDAVVPHGLDATALARAIESRYLKDVIAAEGRLLDEQPRRPLPTARGGEANEQRVRSLLLEKVDAAASFTRGTCGKCHDVRDAAVPDAAGLLTAGVGGGPRWFEVLPTAVPDIWLSKARFNHRAHQAYSCRECHAAAYGDEAGQPSVGSPLDNSIVMIAGRDSCTACHAPAGSDPHTGKPVGGARFDCVECHGYHGLGPHAAPAAAAVTQAAFGR